MTTITKEIEKSKLIEIIKKRIEELAWAYDTCPEGHQTDYDPETLLWAVARYEPLLELFGIEIPELGLEDPNNVMVSYEQWKVR